MKNIILLFIAVIVIVFAACKKSYNPPLNGSYMMFVNTCVDAGNVYVTANNSSLGSVPYLGHTKYQYVLPGVDTIAFLLNNLDTLRKAVFGTTAGDYYSFYAIGSVSNPTTFVVYDDMYEPAKGTAKIRFLNLSDDSLSETVSVQPTTAGLELSVIATGVRSRSASPFAQIAAPGSFAIQASDTARGVTLTTSAQQLDSGKIYTVILAGSSGNVGTSALTLMVIENNQ